MVRLTAYEKDLVGMKVGSRVQFRVNGLGKTTFHAILVSIGQQVDDANRSIELYAKVSDTSLCSVPACMYLPEWKRNRGRMIIFAEE